MAFSVLLLTLALNLCCVQVTLASDFNLKDLNDTRIQNLDKYCKTSGCGVKCCPRKYATFFKDEHYCISTDELVKKCDIVNSSASKFTDTVETGGTYFESVEDHYFQFNFLESGALAIRVANHSGEPKNEQPRFCIELKVISDNGTLTPNVSVQLDAESNLEMILCACGMLTSCVALLLVLVVYALLPELRNLAGLMLMACMATYFAFFMIRVIHMFAFINDVISAKGCLTFTLIFYYLMMSSYCWMNVMSFDIYWTFRGMRKSVQIHRRGGMSKFRWYCAYAWGLPVLPTIFVVVVDQLDLTHLPNFVKPQLPTEESGTCYFEYKAFVWYVCVPAGIVISANVVLFVMTSYNIFRVKRSITRYSLKDRKYNKRNEYRFWVYLRLSLVMGVSWIIEVISNVVDIQSSWWYIEDCYNSLIGVLFFLLFVCKKKTFLRLCAKYSIENRLVRWVRSRASARAADDARPGHTDASDVDAHLTSSDATGKCISDV